MVNTRAFKAEEYLPPSTVRIDTTRGRGTGFFVSRGTILTSYHVLYTRDGSRIARGITDCNGRYYDLEQVSIVPADDGVDLALVLLKVDTPEGVTFIPEIRLGDEFYSFGYTDEVQHGDSLTATYEGPTRAAHPLLKFKAGQVRPGMSGAPVLNLRTGGVCGVLVQTRDRRSPVGGRAIPSSYLLESAEQSNGTEWSRAVASTCTFLQSSALDRAAHNTLTARLNLVLDDLMSRSVAGSRRMHLGDLFGPDGIMVPFRAERVTDRLLVEPVQELVNRLERPDSAARHRVLALAPGGAGKSTFSATIFKALLHRFSAGSTTSVPVLLDLRDYREQARQPDFGTKSWLNGRLDSLAGTSASFRVTSDQAPLSAFLILDSLDEFLAARPPNETIDFLSSYVFRSADVVCCRTTFFDQHLVMYPEMARFERYALLDFGGEQVERYYRAYFRKFYLARSETLCTSFEHSLETVRGLAELCHRPLRLNMALDLFSPGDSDLSNITDLLALYHAYTHGLLLRESARRGSILPSEDKAYFLEFVAWNFYDEGSMGSSTAPPFTETELRKALADTVQNSSGRHVDVDLRTLLADIKDHTMLEWDGGVFVAIEPGTLRFQHKTFQEYFAARYLYHSMLYDAREAALAWRRQLSPEVSEFLKLYLDRARSEPRWLSQLVDNTIEAFHLNRSMDTASSELKARARIARSQIGYYLGALGDPKSTTLLGALLSTEMDPWIRRGITIGLAIGGSDSEVHRYIARLKAEREAGRDSIENGVNIGFHLTFFGDQPFDLYTPDVDKMGPRCGRSIRRLAYQLETRIDRGSWRLNLYTIVDLWRYRPSSRDDCRQALRTSAQSLRRTVARLSADRDSQWWPELRDLEYVLDEVEEIGDGK